MELNLLQVAVGKLDGLAGGETVAHTHGKQAISAGGEAGEQKLIFLIGLDCPLRCALVRAEEEQLRHPGRVWRGARNATRNSEGLAAFQGEVCAEQLGSWP
jgi:hypothetical protein